MEDLVYTELEIQNYLLTEDISTVQKRIVFQFRTGMSDFDENYGSSDTPCKMCSFHRDSQSHSVNCYETMSNVKSKGNYNEIFANKISKETACMLEQIMETRKNKLAWARVKMENMPTRPMCTSRPQWWSNCVLPIQMNNNSYLCQILDFGF